MTMRVPTLTTRTVQAQPLQAPMMQARVSPADGGGLAAQGMAQAGDQMQDVSSQLFAVADRLSARQEAVARADAFTKFEADAQAEWTRLQTEDDVSNFGTLVGYKKFLAQKQEEYLGSHDGRDDSKARLSQALIATTARYGSIAANASAEAGMKKVERLVGDQINTLSAKVSADPSHMGQAFKDFGAMLDNYSPGLTPEQETGLMQAGQRAIVRGAVMGQINRPGGALAVADMLRDNPMVMQYLSPDDQLQIRQHIDTAKYAGMQAQMEAEAAMTRFQAFTGRPPNAYERLQLAGISRQGDPLAKERGLLELVKTIKPDATPAELLSALGVRQQDGSLPSGFRRTADGTALEPIPGGPADPGTPNTMDRSTLKKAKVEVAGTLAALSDLRKAINDAGGGSLAAVVGYNSPTATKLNTAYNNAALMAKGESLYNLGVLNGQDLEVIRRTITDPSTMKSLTTSPEAWGAQIEQVEKLINDRLTAMEQQYGGGGAEKPAPAKPEAKSGDAGKPVIKLDLSGNVIGRN